MYSSIDVCMCTKPQYGTLMCQRPRAKCFRLCGLYCLRLCGCVLFKNYVLNMGGCVSVSWAVVAYVFEFAGDHVESGANGVGVARDGHDALGTRAVRNVDPGRALRESEGHSRVRYGTRSRTLLRVQHTLLCVNERPLSPLIMLHVLILTFSPLPATVYGTSPISDYPDYSTIESCTVFSWVH